MLVVVVVIVMIVVVVVGAEQGGAVFEMQLPILNDQTQAAE